MDSQCHMTNRHERRPPLKRDMSLTVSSSYRSKPKLVRPEATPLDARNAMEPISSVSRSELIAALRLRKKAIYVNMMRACLIGASGAISFNVVVLMKTSNTDSMTAKRDAYAHFAAELWWRGGGESTHHNSRALKGRDPAISERTYGMWELI